MAVSDGKPFKEIYTTRAEEKQSEGLVAKLHPLTVGYRER